MSIYFQPKERNEKKKKKFTEGKCTCMLWLRLEFMLCVLCIIVCFMSMLERRKLWQIAYIESFYLILACNIVTLRSYFHAPSCVMYNLFSYFIISPFIFSFFFTFLLSFFFLVCRYDHPSLFYVDVKVNRICS